MVRAIKVNRYFVTLTIFRLLKPAQMSFVIRTLTSYAPPGNTKQFKSKCSLWEFALKRLFIPTFLSYELTVKRLTNRNQP